MVLEYFIEVVVSCRSSLIITRLLANQAVISVEVRANSTLPLLTVGNSLLST